MKQRRVFHEWQHPRDGRGRFSRSGGASWAKRAAAGFAKAEEGRVAPPAVAGRPRIGRNAKAAAILNQHMPGAGDALSKKWTPPPKLPEGASLRTIDEIQDTRERIQVQHEGKWLDVGGWGSRRGEMYVNLRTRDGGTVQIDDTGQRLVTRPHQLEVKEPLDPDQAKIMAGWRADAAQPPRMRILTHREDSIERHQRELADAEKALKEAKRKARARVRKKYPASDGYSKHDWDYYVENDDAVRQAERDVYFPRRYLEHAQQPDSNPRTEEFLNSPGNRMPVVEGELNRDRPLAVYGDLMNIQDDDQATFRHVQALTLIPAELHAIVARMMFHRRTARGVGDRAGVFVGSRPVTELNHSEDLVDEPTSLNAEAVDGYRDDRLWHNVGGVYRPWSGTLIAGAAGNSGRTEHGQTAAHEFGHALDHAVGDLLRERGEDHGGPDASDSPEWRDIWRQAVAAGPDMNPYYSKQGEKRGTSEMWAEAFGQWSRSRALGRASSRFKEDTADDQRKYLELVGRRSMEGTFRLPHNHEASAALNAYFERLVDKLGVTP